VETNEKRVKIEKRFFIGRVIIPETFANARTMKNDSTGDYYIVSKYRNLSAIDFIYHPCNSSLMSSN
jgi:hypothetical protein